MKGKFGGAERDRTVGLLNAISVEVKEKQTVTS
jgi:hypothetical protein